MLDPAYFSAAQIFGYVAFACGVACFAQTDDRRFKVFMALECFAYVLHFWLLGQPTAVARACSHCGCLMRCLTNRRALGEKRSRGLAPARLCNNVHGDL